MVDNARTAGAVYREALGLEQSAATPGLFLTCASTRTEYPADPETHGNAATQRHQKGWGSGAHQQQAVSGTDEDRWGNGQRERLADGKQVSIPGRQRR